MTTAIPADLGSMTDTAPVRTRRHAAASSVPGLQFGFTVLAVLVGLVLVLASYRNAYSHSLGSTHWYIFWAGMALIVLPCLALLARADLTAGAGIATSATLATAVYGVHFLRAPTRPYFGDEFGHLLQVNQILHGSTPFAYNALVRQASNFPGFESFVVGVHDATGLPAYTVGVVMLVIAHVSAVLCVQRITGTVASARAARLAGAFLAFGPQFQFFDSLFAYESLGVPLALGGVCCAVEVINGRDRGRVYCAAFATASAALLSVCVLTHHLSSYFGVISVLVLCVGTLARRRANRDERAAAELALVGIPVAAFAAVWAIVRPTQMFTYLSVYLVGGFSSLASKFGIETSEAPAYGVTNQGRTPLASADYPVWQLWATYLFPLIVMVLCAHALWINRRRWNPVLTYATVLGLSYGFTLPLLFTASGQNAAHRSWAFNFVGLAILVGISSDALLERMSAVTRSAARLAVLKTGTLVVAMVALIGSYGSGISYLTLFPGPFVLGSEGRSSPVELWNVAHRIERLDPNPDGGVILGVWRDSLLISGATGLQIAPVTASAVFSDAGPTPGLVSEIRHEGGFVVLDQRAAQILPSQGYLFNPGETDVSYPLPARVRARVLGSSWLTFSFRTQHYVVYRIEPVR